jgi:hypothetical protein
MTTKATAKKPSRKGPMIALAVSIYATGGAFVDAFIDTESDQLSALECFPLAVLCVAFSWWWLERRINAIEDWKNERWWAWIMKDLPNQPNED